MDTDAYGRRSVTIVESVWRRRRNLKSIHHQYTLLHYDDSMLGWPAPEISVAGTLQRYCYHRALASDIG